MIPTDLPLRLLGSRQVRLAIAVAVALVWFVTLWTGELGRNGGLAFVYGVPAVLVFIWWRTRPWLALALAAVTLVIVLFGAVNGTAVNGGGIAACTTAWFAILGAGQSNDSRVRITGVGFAILDTFLTAANSGPVAALIVAFLAILALTAGWAWRQLRANGQLRSRLTESQQHVEAAERDVLLELERNRIAREVHDVVAHSLAVVIAQADGARFAADTKPASVAPALEAISDTARRALGEVRTMLHDLRASGEGGVVPGPDDLAGLVEGVRALGVEVDEVAFGEPQPLDRRTGLAIYRIAQEALTNAMRHGDRHEPVGVELDWGDREVVLVVTNAVPEEAVSASERAGHGITGMRERAVDVGGDCSAGVGTNGRFRVRVALPIPTPALEGTAAEAESERETEPNPLAALMAQLAGPRA